MKIVLHMKKHKYVYIIIWGLLASCSGTSKTSHSISPYQRQPITEVSPEQLSNDSLQIEATMQQLLGKHDEAVAMYHRLLGKSPNYSPAHYELGKMYFSMGWLDSALYYTRQACRIDDKNNWYKIQLAQVYEHLRDTKNLTATWEDLVRCNPDVVDYYYNLSNAYLYANNVPSSIEVLDRVEKRFGVTETVSLQKQKLWYAIDKPDKARKELEKLASSMPTESRYNAILAESYMAEKNYPKALQYYNLIYEHNPNDENINVALASCHLAMYNMPQAYRHLRLGMLNRAISCKDRLVYLSEFLRNEKFFNAFSKECFLLADTIACQCNGESDHSLLYGQMLAAQERYAEAVEQFKAFIAIDRSQYTVWEALLICESHLPDSSKALIEDARQASELFPLHLRPYVILVQEHLRLGNCEEAKHYLDRCLMIAPNDITIKQLTQQCEQQCH